MSNGVKIRDILLGGCVGVRDNTFVVEFDTHEEAEALMEALIALMDHEDQQDKNWRTQLGGTDA